MPYLYPLFEITVLAAIYYYMKWKHEGMSLELGVRS
jgi:hypothetical protein